MPIEAEAFEPEGTNIVVAVLAGKVLPVTAIVIPLIEKEPVGLIRGVILALLTVTDAPVVKLPLTTDDVAEV